MSKYSIGVLLYGAFFVSVRSAFKADLSETTQDAVMKLWKYAGLYLHFV